MKLLTIRKADEPIATVSQHRKGIFSRLRGLLGRQLAPDGGLMLTPCSCIHTIGMRYAIDAVYLDRAYQVLRVDHAIARQALQRPAWRAACSGVAGRFQCAIFHRVTFWR